MPSSNSQSHVVEALQKRYASLRDFENLSGQLANVISADVVKLPPSVLSRVQGAVKAIESFAHEPNWLKELKTPEPHQAEALVTAAKPSSVLMSYDFHYDFTDDRLSLIEINTNASLYLVAAALYDCYGVKPPTVADPLGDLRRSFTEEWGATPKCAAIVDHRPRAQKMFFEFLMYRELFGEWGVPNVGIFDVNETAAAIASGQCQFVYNRHTDFYLIEPESQPLWSAWRKSQIQLSPHPREYLLLADKQRLIDFSKRNVSEVLIPTASVAEFNPEDLWAQKKKYFFKPRASFGAKAAYRGASMTTKVFKWLLTRDYVAQEYRPAGEWNGLKFDLRFFVYKSDIQLGCARIYQGQVTNFLKPGGGIAPIQF